MSAAHAELHRLIIGRTATSAVERILAAGYAKPRQVSSVEELDALPEGTVALGWAVGGRTVYLRVMSARGSLVWGCVGSNACYASDGLLKEDAEATVLHVGGAE